MPEYEIMPFASEAEWEAWLEENHTTMPGLWLKLAKKDSGHASITYAEALDVALCFGWIDGQKNKFDDEYWLQKFTPRRSKSPWSQINREKVANLIAAGRMREAGQREIDRAKADGRWDIAYGSSSTIEVPEDFQAALADNPEAGAFFDTLNRTHRYSILYQIVTAKKAETRQKRIEKFITMLNANENPNKLI